MRGGLVRVA
ncbi:hypothetical protein, conserved in T. vivax [Trypanosoma vivax Y486]|uniref:Uncharacterized protein n=1 Tax=Trypanosoma vivax (strain Y486) TaxID=1055687 RepID=F9WT54_TRYVY|nr:hypothetical protein, conserved in T. vivax [Trypanosoma vivax Y486]|eukprot:CCD20745.1 hypothetical protein, conserved in T. vivax [Trypanosoma vivax Y486]